MANVEAGLEEKTVVTLRTGYSEGEFVRLDVLESFCERIRRASGDNDAEIWVRRDDDDCTFLKWERTL